MLYTYVHTPTIFVPQTHTTTMIANKEEPKQGRVAVKVLQQEMYTGRDHTEGTNIITNTKEWPTHIPDIIYTISVNYYIQLG